MAQDELHGMVHKLVPGLRHLYLLTGKEDGREPGLNNEPVFKVCVICRGVVLDCHNNVDGVFSSVHTRRSR